MHKMNSTVLHPPTDRFIGDKMSRLVMQRNGTSFMIRPTTDSTGAWEGHCESPNNLSSEVDVQFSPTDRKRKRQESNYFPNSKLMMLAVSSSAISQPVKKEPQFKGGEAQKAEIMALVDAQTKRDRETRRLRQIRYRQKKENYTFQLEEETRQLRLQIEELEGRGAVSAAVPCTTTLWNVAVEYFRLFRCGLREPVASAVHEMQPCAQLDFLRAKMAPDVMFNTGRGVESIIRNWQYFTHWFQDVEVKLEGLKKGGVDSLVASITTSFTITKRSLIKVFPHLCTQEAHSHTRTLLANKLLGQRIVIQGLTRFEWDGEYGRVTSVISESDMLTPILRILGNLEDVAQVFEKSLISLTPYRGLNGVAR